METRPSYIIKHIWFHKLSIYQNIMLFLNTLGRWSIMNQLNIIQHTWADSENTIFFPKYLPLMFYFIGYLL